jgi:hypothetical protein
MLAKRAASAGTGSVLRSFAYTAENLRHWKYGTLLLSWRDCLLVWKMARRGHCKCLYHCSAPLLESKLQAHGLLCAVMGRTPHSTGLLLCRCRDGLPSSGLSNIPRAL